MFRSKPPRNSPPLPSSALRDPPDLPFPDNARHLRRARPWRRARGAPEPPLPSPIIPSAPSLNDSASEESFSVPVTANNNPTVQRPGALKRISGLFKESDGRFEENLKSMKRRVVQVRRQPDHAPVKFQMGFRSRTGWEPIRARKENQDCLVALVPWGPSSSYNFFAALDGHGRNGHQCSIFVAERVVAYLNRMLLDDADPDTIANTMHKAIAYAERKLESPKVTIDYQLSGSTGVFVLVHGAKLFCANIGDSRAVIGRERDSSCDRARRTQPAGRGSETPKKGPRNKNQGEKTSEAPESSYFAVPLSIDQKPSRPDEKERLLKAGARVETWDGVDVGDERVWLPDIRTPGLAVSRSFGDLIVKEYGVNCVPEVYTLDLAPDDRFLVMASDGVFEFMSNTEVVNVVGEMRDTSSPQDAAEELVRQATERWIEDDSVIDDISCVVVYMEVITPEVSGPMEPVHLETSLRSADTLSDADNGPSSRNLSRSPSIIEGFPEVEHGIASASAPDFSARQRIDGHPDEIVDPRFEDAEEEDDVEHEKSDKAV